MKKIQNTAKQPKNPTTTKIDYIDIMLCQNGSYKALKVMLYDKISNINQLCIFNVTMRFYEDRL